VSDDDFARLLFRVFLILKNSGERIGEDRQRFLKIYAVGCLIGLRLLGIPLKRDTHPPAMITAVGFFSFFLQERPIWNGREEGFEPPTLVSKQRTFGKNSYFQSM